VARRARLRDLFLFSPLRRRTVRFRLTVLYSCLFFPSGVVLVAVTYVLIVLVQRPNDQVTHPVVVTHRSTAGGLSPSGVSTDPNSATPVHLTIIGHSVALDTGEFLLGACVLLIAMIGVSVLLGWFAAGRVLRPLRVMTSTTRRISERNLNERLALAGPEDELKDLADTIDGLLARLEAAFDSQRRFVANASHELRTPLMLSQTLLQVALADPAISVDSLRTACEEAIDAGKDQAQLIEALLTLARSQRGLDEREPVDLKAVVSQALDTHQTTAAAKGIQVEGALDDATVVGDPLLLYRLVSNLIDNAIRYNVAGGRVEVKLAASTTSAALTVSNTGPPVAPDQISRLLQPFQRAARDRIFGRNGLGLGLSIVTDIARAHGAILEVRPGPQGGLTVTTNFSGDTPVVPEARNGR
jgi:signal transduction histidine kinase